MPSKPKSYVDKVCAAIRALQESKGSSRQAIAKYLKTEFESDNTASLRKAFKTGVDKGLLVQEGARFSLKGVTFAEKDDGY